MPARLTPSFTRRDVLRKGGALSVAGAAMLAGASALAAANVTMPAVATPNVAAAPKKDVDLLNSALALAHQGIAAYQIGIDNGQLQQPGLNVALLFQSHHKTHRDTLIAAVQKLSGTPVAALTSADYAHNLDASALKGQLDILDMMTKLELDGANACLALVPGFADRDLAKLIARIAADNAMHWTALLSVLQRPLPANAMIFGA